MQQAVRDLNFPLSDVRMGNAVLIDREVADARISLRLMAPTKLGQARNVDAARWVNWE